MATTQTVNLPGHRTGPFGGTAFRFDFFADDEVTPADRSVATRMIVTELLQGVQVGPTYGVECIRLGLEDGLGIRGLSAQQAATFLMNWAS